jgi:hypothetical protein
MRHALLLALWSTSIVWAQGSVTIYGTVQDVSGAVLASVSVRVQNEGTGLVRSVTSDERGAYIATQLPVGIYTVSAELAGFKRYLQRNIQVQVDENRQVPIVLQLGDVNESVTVESEMVQVDTRSGTIREVVDSNRIVELPLNGRNPLDLQLLVAGAGRVTPRGQAQNTSVSINGARDNANNYTLDGGDNHDPYFNSPSVFPQPDALAEFSIQTNAYGAEYGRNAGIQVNAVSKSGTNKLHGSLFEFLRNDKLNARNYFSNIVPPFKRNQFGGTLGGPIIRDRTFFFGSFQGTRSRSAPGSVTAAVPSAAERRGDFSAYLPRTIRDPLTNQSFPGNMIPANRVSRPAVNFLDAFIPLPNRPDGLFTFASQDAFDQDQYLIKGDHRFNSANQLSARYLYNKDKNKETPGTVPNFIANIQYRNINFSATDTHIFSPTLINVATFTFGDVDRAQFPTTPGNKSWNDFGAKFVPSFINPAIPVAHATNVAGRFNAFARYPLDHFRNNLEIADKINWTRGPHLIKFGFELRRSNLDLAEWGGGECTCSFNGQFSGDSMADFMLGRPNNVNQSSPAVTNSRLTELMAFVQDDWRVNSRLTLNLGMRWDPFVPYVDGNDQYAAFRPGQKSQVFVNAPLGFVTVGDAGVPRATIPNRWGQFAPRLGFAWDPTGSGRTSIRGGYGVFFSTLKQQNTLGPSANQPFVLRFVVIAPPGGLENPYSTVPGGVPLPFNRPTTPDERRNARFVLPITINEWNAGMRNGYMQQWNINVQREFFRSYLVTAAYVGSKGTKLRLQKELNPAIYTPGTSTVANTDARRALAPTYGSIITQLSNGNSTYHSAQLSLNRRFTRGFTLLASYTFSKLIDIGSDDNYPPSNPNDFRNERGLSDFDIPHRFVASYIWELPRLRSHPALVRHVIGGWETNGIFTIQSGQVLTVRAGVDRSLIGVNRDRADLVGNPSLSTDRPNNELVNRYFNTAAFALPVLGTFGTVGRNTIRGPGLTSVDFGLLKNFHFFEQHRLQFRAEFFNLLNQTAFGNPNTAVNNPQFGRITTAGSPRVVQLALRYSF